MIPINGQWHGNGLILTANVSGPNGKDRGRGRRRRRRHGVDRAVRRRNVGTVGVVESAHNLGDRQSEMRVPFIVRRDPLDQMELFPVEHGMESAANRTFNVLQLDPLRLVGGDLSEIEDEDVFAVLSGGVFAAEHQQPLLPDHEAARHEAHGHLAAFLAVPLERSPRGHVRLQFGAHPKVTKRLLGAAVAAAKAQNVAVPRGHRLEDEAFAEAVVLEDAHFVGGAAVNQVAAALVDVAIEDVDVAVDGHAARPSPGWRHRALFDKLLLFGPKRKDLTLYAVDDEDVFAQFADAVVLWRAAAAVFHHALDRVGGRIVFHHAP